MEQSVSLSRKVYCSVIQCKLFYVVVKTMQLIHVQLFIHDEMTE